MFDPAADLYDLSRAYIESVSTPHESLAAACGASETELAALETAGVLPAPTYTIFESAIRSPIRVLGEPPPAKRGRRFYCPAVLPWLRRALELQRRGEAQLLQKLEHWFATEFEEALRRQAVDARQHAWSHLFDGRGEPDGDAVAAQVGALCLDWLNGGWAVCLRCWNGYHVVTKDLERARIGAITDNGARRSLSADERLALIDAIERLDSVMLPFAPYERPHGTPGLFIDAMRERYRL